MRAAVHDKVDPYNSKFGLRAKIVSLSVGALPKYLIEIGLGSAPWQYKFVRNLEGSYHRAGVGIELRDYVGVPGCS